MRTVSDPEVGLVLVVERTQRARQDYTCDDCGQIIPQGDTYRYRWSVIRDEPGSGVAERFHGLCGPY